MTPKSPLVIVFHNQKGGSGKTTNTFHFSVALARLFVKVKSESRPIKVLAVDMDPQTDLSDAFFPDDPIEVFDAANSFTVIRSETTLAESVREKHGMHVLVSTMELNNFGFHVTQNSALLLRLASVVRKAPYDVVVIDTPGAGGPETLGAFIAADLIVIPVLPTKWATRTIESALRKMNEAQDFINESQGDRQLKGFILPTKWGRKKDPSERVQGILEQLRNYDQVLQHLRATPEKAVGLELVSTPECLEPIPQIPNMDEKTEFGEPLKEGTPNGAYYTQLAQTLLRKDTTVSLANVG